VSTLSLVTLGPAGNGNIRIPTPRLVRRNGAAGPTRLPLVRIIIGSLALAALAFTLVEAIAANHDNDAYVKAPICTGGAVGSGCVAVAPATVNFAYVDRSGKVPVGELDLGSTAPGVGHVTVTEDVTFVEKLQTNDQVQVQLWHGKVVAVTSGNETVGTTDSPALANVTAVLFAIVSQLVAFVVLRSASRARLAYMLQRELKRGPEVRMMRLFGFGVVVVAVVGTYGLAIGELWGAIAIAVAFAAVAYSVVVPHLWRSNIVRW
jgi:hypothetical protein